MNVNLSCEDGVTIVNKGRLASMSILPKGLGVHDELKIERRNKND